MLGVVWDSGQDCPSYVVKVKGHTGLTTLQSPAINVKPDTLYLQSAWLKSPADERWQAHNYWYLPDGQFQSSVILDMTGVGQWLQDSSIVDLRILRMECVWS